nr:DUF4290 domain-containing protein [uncultured Prevotella sp.]
MNLEGLDYNTQRSKLVLPEYGRTVQKMVDYAMTIEDREKRQKCAEAIIAIMDRMYPEGQDTEDHLHKLWDHLALMSGFKLDVDYPYDIREVKSMTTSKPKPLPYPMQKIPVKHYGSLMFETFDKLKDMKPGEERDELTRIVANQMKRDLVQWSHGLNDDEKIAADLAKFTDGKIQLDIDKFEFDRNPMQQPSQVPLENNSNNKRKRK